MAPGRALGIVGRRWTGWPIRADDDGESAGWGLEDSIHLGPASLYVEAGDKRDKRALERVMHADFRVLAQMPDGVSVMGRALYLDLIKQKKIGGSPRDGNYSMVLYQDQLATVYGTLDSKAAHFDCTWTLAKAENGWVVVQDAVVFTPR